MADAGVQAPADLAVETAVALRAAGLSWTPAPGDRFVLPGKDMDDHVFVLSDMTIEVHEFASGPVIGFNGTTEWALDSVAAGDALWLPREDQLRESLGERLLRLDRHEGAWTVLLDDGTRHDGVSPAEAYAGALLASRRAQRQAG